jgi:hypothetical protein
MAIKWRSHGIDLHAIETNRFHFLLNPLNNLLFLAAFTGNRDHIPQKF